MYAVDNHGEGPTNHGYSQYGIVYCTLNLMTLDILEASFSCTSSEDRWRHRLSYFGVSRLLRASFRSRSNLVAVQKQ